MSAGYVPEQFYLRSADEMKARFAEVPEAVTNTLEVAEKCNLEIKFGTVALPGVSSAGTFHARRFFAAVARGRIVHAATRFTRRRREKNLSSRALTIRRGCRLIRRREVGSQKSEDRFWLNDPAVAAAIKTVIDRLQLELTVIEKTGFISYFLIVGDFIRYGRSQGISCVARGSAAGSLVTYLLEIANVDPIRYGLLFERFLNPERVNPPDIDIDFADDRRADVIEYVRKKYGNDSVAQIITFGTMGAKSVVRDVGRVMGLPYGDCDRLAKMIPFDLKMDLEEGAQAVAGIQGGLRDRRSHARAD